MKQQRHTGRIFLQLFNLFLLSTLVAGGVEASDVVTPNLTEPIQKEKFFDQDRYSFTASPDSEKPVVEPHLSVSHDSREKDIGIGVIQKAERVHGEAGGKLNLLGDISLTSFAKVPVYTKETIESQNNSDGSSSSQLLSPTGQLSWRSELGVPVKKGVDLNFFYDNSAIGKIDKPGIEGREEKFGTRFIFKFE